MTSKKKRKWRAADISRKDFNQHAKPVEMKFDGVEQTPLKPRQFRTGSFGWQSNQMTWIKVNGKNLLCRVTMSVTVVGSKLVPADGEPEPQPGGTADA